mmetsp:Transcript_3266/g.9396  ORF Transcript_3266/g.9396 Transcript_3266/m.9396 type:complete len:406 (+) Transcript_3266:41-1258(+)
MAWLVLLLLASILRHGDAHHAASTTNRLPRGGGDMSQFLEAAASDDDASTVTYPPLSPEEIRQSLRDVPVYYIDRRDDGGILVAGGGGGGAYDDGWRRQQAHQKACYFFLEKDAALANLEQVVKGGKSDDSDDGSGQGQKGQELQVSTARLGQLYEKFWSSRNHDETADEVEFRLVPINKELLRARFLLTVTPSDIRRQLSEAEGRRLLAKVNAHPKRFKNSYDDIPLFVSSNMRLKMSRIRRTRAASSRWPRLLVPRFRRGKASDNNLALPVYFTVEDMKRDMERAPGVGGQRPSRESGSDAGTIIINLGELLTQMGNESRGFDYRDVVFVPPGRKGAGTPFLLDGDSSNSASSVSTVTDSIQEVDGGEILVGGESEDDRVFWLRPRRRVRQQDLDALFGPDQQ